MPIQDLVSFINKSLQRGESRETITAILLEKGWTQEAITQAFAAIPQLTVVPNTNSNNTFKFPHTIHIQFFRSLTIFAIVWIICSTIALVLLTHPLAWPGILGNIVFVSVIYIFTQAQKIVLDDNKVIFYSSLFSNTEIPYTNLSRVGVQIGGTGGLGTRGYASPIYSIYSFAFFTNSASGASPFVFNFKPYTKKDIQLFLSTLILKNPQLALDDDVQQLLQGNWQPVEKKGVLTMGLYVVVLFVFYVIFLTIKSLLTCQIDKNADNIFCKKRVDYQSLLTINSHQAQNTSLTTTVPNTPWTSFQGNGFHMNFPELPTVKVTSASVPFGNTIVSVKKTQYFTEESDGTFYSITVTNYPVTLSASHQSFLLNDILITSMQGDSSNQLEKRIADQSSIDFLIHNATDKAFIHTKALSTANTIYLMTVIYHDTIVPHDIQFINSFRTP